VAHNAFAALQDVTSDALAVERLPQAERGKANGVMAGGKWAGTLVGGPALAFVSSKLGWSGGVLRGRGPAARAGHAGLAARGAPDGAPPIAAFPLCGGAALHRARGRPGGALLSRVGASDNFLYPVILPLFRQKLGFSEDR
jgi:hypothetical protein